MAWSNAEGREIASGAIFRGYDDSASSYVISVDKDSAISATALSFFSNGYVLKGDSEGTVLTLSSAENANASISIYPGKVAMLGDPAFA